MYACVLSRAEVMAMIVPKDDDEWLLFETARLTEFTRLYPPPKPAAPPADSSGSVSVQQAAAAAAELEVEVQGEEENEEDDEEGGVGGAAKEGGKDALSPHGSTKNKDKTKSATYEEIIFQVCVLFSLAFH